MQAFLIMLKCRRSCQVVTKSGEAKKACQMIMKSEPTCARLAVIELEGGFGKESIVALIMCATHHVVPTRLFTFVSDLL